MEESSPSVEQEAIALVRELNSIEFSNYRVIGGIVRYSQSARNSMKDVKQRIIASLTSRPFGCDNYLLWAPPGSGKSFFVQEIAKSLGDAIHYREINLAQMDETQFRKALSELETLDKPRLCLVDEVDSKPQESWPYEALLPSLEPPSGGKTIRTCFVLAGSSGGSTSGMKEGILKRPKGTDLLSRIPPGNEFEIERLGLGDRLLVASTQFLNVARDEGREIHEVEKLVLYYVALNPKLRSARNIRQLAVRCMERIPPAEDRIRYDHLFDPGDPENKEFWFSTGPLRSQFVNVFVTLNENDRTSVIPPRLISTKLVTEASPLPVVAKAVLDRNRVAVMPLVNMISDSTDEYFVDGMTEELISAISLVNELNVISRTSVMSYKRKQNKRTIDIGRELNVGTLLEGSVRKAGNRVRISVQLIDVENDKHLWAQNYDRSLEDVFAIQSDIAAKVAESLESHLLPGRRHKIESGNTKNVDAHLLYLKGRESFFKLTREALEGALQYYSDAIEKDPQYALAYAAMAETYFILGNQDYVTPEESYPKIKENAGRAVSLDKTLSEARLALGHSSWLGWNFDEAEKEYRHSIELNPSSSLPHSYLSILLSIMERYDEAQAEAKRAIELDPLSSLTYSYAGFAYLYALNYERTIEVLEKAVKLNPLNAIALEDLGLAHVQQGIIYTGLDEMIRGNQIDAPNVNPTALSELAYAYAKAGYDNKPHEILSQLLDGIERNPGWAAAIAGVYSILGEKEKAFDWLERAYKAHSGYLPFIASEITFDNIRSDPRFNQLLVKIGLRKPRQSIVLSGSVGREEKLALGKRDSQRIAVLPFTNISPDPKDEYFADGMTEELISTFSKIRELKVISRTSVMRYKQTSKSLSEIANELKVNAILEGSVRKMGDDLRITAQLIDVQNDEHLWSEDYDRKFENVFSLQKEIAQKVADSLQITILVKENKELGKKPTQNLEAYSLYLKGRSYLHRFTLASFKKAIEYCELAIQKDPNYAQAYAQMANCFSYIGVLELLPSSESFPQAGRFAERAIQLDPSIPESHLALGLDMLDEKWDFRLAEIEFRRALESNPNLVDGHLYLAQMLVWSRRFDEAILECKRALELDPMSAWTCQWAGEMLLFSHQIDESMELSRNAIELDPNSSLAQHDLGLAYAVKGMIDDAIIHMKTSIELDGGIEAYKKGDLAYAYGKAGNTNEVRSILADVLDMRERGYRSEVGIAGAYLSLGEKDKAIEWLENAYQQHVGHFPNVNADFTFDDLRSDPRFKALMKKIGFPDAN